MQNPLMQKINIEKYRDLILFRLSFQYWSNKKQGDLSQVETESNKRQLSLSKKLIDCQQYIETLHVQSKLRAWCLSRSMPSFLDDGLYALKPECVQEFQAKLEESLEEQNAALDKLFEVLPYAVSKAQLELRNQFLIENYPGIREMELFTDEDRKAYTDKFVELFPDFVASNPDFNLRYYKVSNQEYLRSKFSIKWRFVKLEIPNGLPPEIMKSEVEKLQADMAEASNAIVTALREAFAKLISHAVERLTPDADGNVKQFKASTIVNLQEFISTFDKRNLFDDDELKKLVAEAKQIVACADAEIIRDNMEIRNLISSQFQQVEAKLDGMVENKKKRSFNFNE